MELSPHLQRVEGFRMAMQQAGLPVHAEYYRTGSLSAETGYEFAKALLALDRYPTAVFCTNNKTLLGVVRALGESGLLCPDEISLVGFDDFAWTENFRPKLTTVVQPAFEMGQRAFDLLLEVMHETPGADHARRWEPVLLPAELRVRQSTAPPPAQLASPQHSKRFGIALTSVSP